MNVIEMQKVEIQAEVDAEKNEINSLPFSVLTYEKHLDFYSKCIKLTHLYKATCPVLNAVKIADDLLIENILNEIFPPAAPAAPTPAIAPVISSVFGSLFGSSSSV